MGALDADDLTIVDYPGNAFNTVILYVDTGSDATSRLIARIDTAAGIPFAGTNSLINITIVWSNESTRIISL